MKCRTCCALVAAALLSIGHRVWGQSQRLSATDAHAFGHATAAYGDLVAVGAPNSDSGAGAAFVYRADPVLGWVQELRLSGNAHEALGSSIALYGDHLLVGAPGGGTAAGGTAYILRRTSQGWQHEMLLEAPVPVQGDAFGAAVALWNIYAFVGAPSGAQVYAFENASPSQWTYRQTLTNNEPQSAFGAALALTGELAAIGAPLADEPRGQAAGKAYIFARTGGAHWVETATLVAGDAAGQSVFGTAIALGTHTVTGDSRALIGASAGGPLRAGAAYFFRNAGGLWSQYARYTPASRAAGDRVGHAVALDEDNMLVGMPGTSMGAGAAVALVADTTVWAWEEDAWHYGQAGAAFGAAMAISAAYVIIGAPEDSTSGAAYVFERSVALPGAAEYAVRPTLTAYPNPFRHQVTLSGAGAPGVPVRLVVYDLYGKRVDVLHGTGPDITWVPPSGLGAGIYGFVAPGRPPLLLHHLKR